MNKIAFAVAVEVRKSPKIQNTQKQWWMPASYTWAFSLWSVRAFGDASDQQGVPTFLVCVSETKAVAEA
nr:MAG TPA: hypothetical protein [Caudoviricetes sp.]